MFQNLTEVPAALQGFYHEELRTEQLLDAEYQPVLKGVPTTFINDDGKEVAGVRYEKIYHDVNYLVLDARGQDASVEKVLRVAEKHKGKRDDVLDTFIEFHLEGVQWAFYDAYMAHLAIEPMPEDAAFFVPEGEGEDVVMVQSKELYDEAHNLWFLATPEKPVRHRTSTFKKQHYAELRRAAYGDWHEQNEMMYDDTWKAHIEAVKIQYPK